MRLSLRLCGALCVSAAVFLATISDLRAAEVNPAPPRITADKTTNGLPWLIFPYPAAQSYQVFSTDDVTNSYTLDTNSGRFLGPTWIVTNGEPARFYKVSATVMDSNDMFIATILNRLTYGPSPDDIDRIRSIGADAFIAEQMAGEAIADSINTDPAITNAPIPITPPNPLTNWIQVTATGTRGPSGTGNASFGFYTDRPGSVYIDRVWLNYGTNAESGTNLLVNGDFEDTTNVPPVNVTAPWTRGSTVTRAVITNSPTVDGLPASGTNCLLLVFNGAASQLNQGFTQIFLTNVPGTTQKMTLSFYYLPVQNTNAITLTARPAAGISGIATGTVVLPTLPPYPPTPPPAPPAIAATYAKLTNATATMDDLRAWHVFRAIHSKRQLHEVLAQFFQNHFTTQYQKTEDYFLNNFSYSVYTNASIRDAIALNLHWREHKKFRDALLDPNCTFYDLLKVSIESEAMTIYLDTILSGKAVPNQNYAREIMELHTMGADNGYVQQDIAELSKVWTGWRVDKKDAAVANNPFAPPIPRTNITNFVDTPGLWVLHFNTNQHHLGTKYVFSNSVIHPRFGAQFGGGTSYALVLSNTLALGTNGMAEGYKAAQHLADLPYTMEYLSVKLCRLFVHENFSYGVYDYTTNNPTPEIALIKDCMAAWQTTAGDGRKGNIRSVLNAIFQSALFRGHGASQQKTKSPLEYAVSAVRALHVVQTDGNNWVSSTCDSDGYGLVVDSSGLQSPLRRMGNMLLFDKPEPDGYSEYGRIWMSTANLCERLRYVQHLMMPTSSSTKNDDYGNPSVKNTSDPVALLKSRLPSTDWNNDAAVVDFFLGLLFPGEGAANRGRDREAAINYLNTNDAGTGSSPFNALNSTAYDGRVRSMVGFLLCLPRFQEQ